MASIRGLKKKIKDMVVDVLDECDYIIVNGGASAEEADRMIDEAVEFHDIMMQRIHAAQSQADFKAITDDLTARGEEFVKRLNAMS